MRCGRCIKGSESPVKTPNLIKRGYKKNSEMKEILLKKVEEAPKVEMIAITESPKAVLESPVKRAQKQKERLKNLQKCRKERSETVVPDIDMEMFEAAQTKVRKSNIETILIPLRHGSTFFFINFIIRSISVEVCESSPLQFDFAMYHFYIAIKASSH